MKRNLIIFPLMLFSVSIMHAQRILPLKVSELRSYIQHADHPLVVDFWATFCGPCIGEIPHFQEQVKKYSDKNLELVLVSLDLPDHYETKIDSFISRQHIDAKLIWLNETNADYFCPQVDSSWSGGIPATLFVNRKTGYRSFVEGELTADAFEDRLKQLVRD